MCNGFCIEMVSMGFSGHINVKVFAGAVAGVVMIQTSGDIWVGRVVAEALHICNEHLMQYPLCCLHTKLLYKMVGLLMGEKVWLCCKSGHWLPVRPEIV